MSQIKLFFAGAPTGTATSGTLALDTTTNRAYVYNGSWQPVTEVKVDNSIWVDATYGSDSTGTREDPTKPFATVAAAITAASALDVIFLSPGTHTMSAAITLNSVSLVGAGWNQTTLSFAPTSNMNAVTVHSASGLIIIKDLAISVVTSTAGLTLRGIYAESPNYQLLGIRVVVQTTGAATSSTQYAFETTAGQAAHPNTQMVNSQFRVLGGTGTGQTNRGALVATASAGFAARGCFFQGTIGGGGTGTAMGVEVNGSGASVTLDGCSCSGGTVGTCNDVSATSGTLSVNGTRFVNKSYNSTVITTIGPPVFVRNTLWVDPTNGSDTLGRRGDFMSPFATIAAANTAASSGDLIVLTPGTHTLSAALTVTAGVKIWGPGENICTISMTGITATTTMITLAEGSIEGVYISLACSGDNTYIGVLITDLANANDEPKIRNTKINVNHSSGTGTAHGIVIRAAGGSYRSIVDSFINLTTSGSTNAASRGVLQDTENTSVCGMIGCTITSGKGAVEINISSGQLTLMNCICSGATFDVSQTAGNLTLVGTVLVSNSSNSLPFIIGRQVCTMSWGHIGAVTSNATRYLYPGAGANSTVEIKLTLKTACIIQNLQLFCTTAPGGTDTTAVTIRKNGIDTTLTCTVTGAAAEAAHSTTAVSFAAGDEISCKIVTSSVLNTVDPMVIVEKY